MWGSQLSHPEQDEEGEGCVLLGELLADASELRTPVQVKQKSEWS